MAYAAKLDNKNHRVFVLLSDGECDEGSNWEAAMFAGHFLLKNLCIIIDYNKLQSIKTTKETMDLEPFKDKWLAFGWDVEEVNGHNYNQLLNSMQRKESTNPKCIIAHTTKGKGVSFMENNNLWHYRSPNEIELKKALDELNEK